LVTQKYILAIDQGTSSTKALVIDAGGRVVGETAPRCCSLKASYSRPGWVEYDPQRMLDSVRESAGQAVHVAGLCFSDIEGVGLANQGETVIAFDAHDGRPVYAAISWQDRRGESITDKWRECGLEPEVFAITGLRLDTYFSAAKLAWILQNVPEARSLHAAGRLRYGTSDAWLLWMLTGGRCFVTDVATASRTMLLDLKTLQWSPVLTEAFGIPISGLPQVVPNSVVVGETAREVLGAVIPVSGICVDQQAALFGHCAFEAGDTKITYGTGCFVLSNIGDTDAQRAMGLLTSVGWQVNETVTFVFDGGVYSAGSLVDWLSELGLARDAEEISQLAGEAGRDPRVMLIPAFNGLAAPRWSSTSRACWLGMDQGTNRGHLLRSSLDAIAFQVREILSAMEDAGLRPRHINVDGGLTRCDLLMQIQSDVLGIPLARSNEAEFTALGVGYLAGLGCGAWSSQQHLPLPPGTTTLFEPDAAAHDYYGSLFPKWKQACSAVIAMGDAGLFRHSSCDKPG
jgi:glycerol kinase